MKSLCVFVALLVHCIAALAERPPDASPARFTVKVVDEDGKPLADTSISAAFVTEEPPLSGATDVDGFFVASCRKAMRSTAGFTVNKAGCYEAHGGCTFAKIVGGRWEPWNPVVTAVVRRVVNPIPMYARMVATMLPATNASCGYDFEIGDWVAPHGVGKQSDVFLRVNRSVLSREDFDLTLQVTFTNSSDGLHTVTPISVSAFKSPRRAPTDGYKTSYERNMGRKPHTGFFNTDLLAAEYCVFRVRTVLDEDGRIKSTHYGKITSGFKVVGYLAEKVTIKFTYYLNPTPNDRNLEFDPKRNLFTHLGEFEGVYEP